MTSPIRTPPFAHRINFLHVRRLGARCLRLPTLLRLLRALSTTRRTLFTNLCERLLCLTPSPHPRRTVRTFDLRAIFKKKKQRQTENNQTQEYPPTPTKKHTHPPQYAPITLHCCQFTLGGSVGFAHELRTGSHARSPPGGIIGEGSRGVGTHGRWLSLTTRRFEML